MTTLKEIDVAALEKVVKLDYTNWKGIRETRRVVPLGTMEFKSNDFHKEPTWLMRVFDLDKMAIRDYAMKDVHSWGKQ